MTRPVRVRNVVADDYCNSNDFRRRSAAERAIERTKTADPDDKMDGWRLLDLKLLFDFQRGTKYLEIL